MPSSHPPFFFSATQSVDNRMGEVFSFTWSSYAGLRELWWQVRGFKSQFPELSTAALEEKFLGGLPLPGGIDFAKTFIETSWPSHEQEFTKWLLFDACTLYEGWAEKVCMDVFQSDTHIKALQYPSGTNSKGRPTGYPLAVAAANAHPSALMVKEFFPKLKTSKLNRWSSVQEHLVAYRYFKECRNSFIHSDGCATQDVVDWHAKLRAIQGNPASPFKHKFALPAPQLGQEMVLDVRDCILLMALVRMLICTLDAALSVAARCEALLEQRLLSIRSSGKWHSLPGDPQKLEQRISRMLVASNIPAPVSISNVVTWMKARQII